MKNLILQAKRGDQAALEQVVSLYKGLVRSLANKFYLVGGDKDDLLQEGMIGLFYAINCYDEDKGSFPSFAETCILRQILDTVKRDSAFKNKPLNNSVDLEKLENVASSSNPLERLLHKEYAEKVAVFIENEFSDFEKQVVRLFSDGYNYLSIAEKTGKTYKAVDSALQRARKKLLTFEKSYLKK